MHFQTLHRDVLQLVPDSNPHSWPADSGDQAFITYFRFDDQAIATAYGKSLIATHWAKEFEVRTSIRFESGYEVKVIGLSRLQIETLVNEFKSKDWLNELFDAQYQAHCDHADLMADHYDSAWA